MRLELGALVLSTLLGAAGLALVATPPPLRDPRPRDRARHAPRLAAAVAVGAVTMAFTGWIVAALVLAASAWTVVGAVQGRDRRTDDVARTEALASWIESLRDVLVAGDQPIGAIAATVSTCPMAIRPHVRRLATSLGRQEPEVEAHVVAHQDRVPVEQRGVELATPLHPVHGLPWNCHLVLAEPDPGDLVRPGREARV